MFSSKSMVLGGAVAALASSMMLVESAGAAVAWNTQIVRNGNDSGATPPTITPNGADGVTTQLWITNQKTAFGTDYFNGQLLSSVDQVTYNRVDTGTTTTSPFVNIWVTDGTHYAIIAPHSHTNGGASPSFGGILPDTQGNNVNGLPLQTLGFSAYENSAGTDYSWMYPGAVRPNGSGVLVDSNNSNAVITLADIGGLTVQNPNNVPGSGWTGGTGAFKGSNGFAIVFGEKQTDGMGDPVAYQLSNVVVPEPGYLGLAGMAASALLMRRRRRA